MNNQYYNNGYNNGYNNYNPNNFNNWNQMPQQNMNYNNDDDNSNKGGGFFSFLLALIILIVAVAFLLHLIGVFDLKELYNKYILKQDETKEVEKTEDKEEQEKEEVTEDAETKAKKQLDNMCSLVDESGNYNVDIDESTFTKGTCGNNVCAYIDIDDELIEKIQKNPDYQLAEGEKMELYTKDCKTGEYNKRTIDYESNFEIMLDTACANVDTNGNYNVSSGDSNVTCTNYECEVTSNGKTYNKTCPR